MDELDFTKVNRQARVQTYDPAIARACFQSVGKVEVMAQGSEFFTQNQASDKMYLLIEGDVSLIRGKKVLDVVKAGEIFGEMAAISRQPRSATAAAKSACRALSLDTSQFESAIQKTPEFALMLMNIMMNRLRMTIAMLAVSKSLHGAEARERRVFDEVLLAALVEALHHRTPQHCPLNKVIMKEGDAGVFMYIVLEGRVTVSIKGKAVEHVGPGGVFGEMALVDQSPRAATATAETDCDLLAITRKDFLELVKTNPAFGVSLLKAAADRLRSMTERR